MKIVILRSAEEDLRWYRHYYERVFQEGRKNGSLRYVAATRVLLKNPLAGRPYRDDETRKFSITGTPFHFIYRVTGNQIQVIQIRDGRASSTAETEALNENES
ncbi:MAG: type II toxin-antitoxin system RelE/ParE family toxin [Rhizobiaceae bacterium]